MTFQINFTPAVQALNAENTIFSKPNSYVPFTFGQLDADTRNNFLLMVAKLHSELVVNDELQVSSMKMDSRGFYDRDFTASLSASEGKLIVSYGRQQVVINTEHPDLTYSIGEFTFDQYPKAVLNVYDDESDISYPIPLNLTPEAFEAALTSVNGKKQLVLTKIAATVTKGKWDKFAEFLKKPGGGGSTQLTDIKELPQMVPMLVKEVKTVAVNYNGTPATSYIVTVDLESNEYSFWMPSNLKQSCELGKVVPNQTSIGYHLTEPNKKGNQYAKGFISQSLNVALPTLEASNKPAVKLPFTSRVEAIDWAQSLIPSLTLEEAGTLASGDSPEDFFHLITKKASEPTPEVVDVVAEVVAEAVVINDEAKSESTEEEAMWF